MDSSLKFWILFTVLPLILRQWADHLRSSSPAFSLPGDWHLIREHTILWLNKESQQLSLKGLFLILSYSGASPVFFQINPRNCLAVTCWMALSHMISNVTFSFAYRARIFCCCANHGTVKAFPISPEGAQSCCFVSHGTQMSLQCFSFSLRLFLSGAFPESQAIILFSSCFKLLFVHNILLVLIIALH